MDAKQKPDETFVALSDEYAQAVEALQAIEREADLLVAGGSADELRAIIARFTELAEGAIARARARGEDHFPEWFEELIQRLERVQEKALS